MTQSAEFLVTPKGTAVAVAPVASVGLPLIFALARSLFAVHSVLIFDVDDDDDEEEEDDEA